MLLTDAILMHVQLALDVGMMQALSMGPSCSTCSSSCSVSKNERPASQVMVSADLNNIPRVEFSFDCSFERSLVADFEAEQQHSSTGAAPASAQVQTQALTGHPDPVCLEH